MELTTAIHHLADGHSLWKVDYAKEICAAFGLELPKGLIVHYENQKDANPNNEPKGLWLNDPDKAIDGVNSLALSDYITEKVLKTKYPPSSEYLGRGFGAQANAGAVAKKLNINC